MASYQIAQGIAQLGRNGDSTLVHMQPHEVAGLQSIAKANGTTLTINPDTGLPEAFNLGGVFRAALPIAAGVALGPAGLGLSALQAGLLTGAAAFALTGDPMQGVTSGFGGYGGAGLGQNLSAFGKVAGPEKVVGPAVTGAKLSSAVPGSTGASAFIDDAAGAGLTSTGSMASTVPYTGYTGAAGTAGTGQLGADMSFKPANLVNSTSSTAVNTTPFTGGVQATKGVASGLSDVGSGIGRIAKEGVGSYSDFLKAGYVDSAGNLVKPSAFADALTVGAPLVMGAMQPQQLKAPTSVGKSFNYQGPYTAQARESRMPTPEEQRALMAQGSPEFSYFQNTNPYPGFNNATFAEGGTIQSGGLQDLYSSSDNVTGPALSRDGYGLGRLQAMSDGGVMRFDAGGQIPTIGGPEISYEMSAEAGKNYAMAPTDLAKVMEAGDAVQATDGSTAPGILGIMGVQRQATNATTDPMGRITGTGINQSNQPFGKNSQQSGFMRNALGNVVDIARGLAPETPKALTMQDYINAARRMYDPSATQATINTSGAPELGQFSNINPQAPQLKAAGGGIHALRSGGKPSKGGYLDGRGDGMSDSIPATIEGKQPARLADGEFVIPADVVSHLGNGSSKAGAKHLYKMMDKVRRARTGKVAQGKKINPNKFLTA
jgi:hypothetical protein